MFGYFTLTLKSLNSWVTDNGRQYDRYYGHIMKPEENLLFLHLQQVVPSFR